MGFSSPGSEDRKKMELHKGKMGEMNSAKSFNKLPKAKRVLAQGEFAGSFPYPFTGFS